MKQFLSSSLPSPQSSWKSHTCSSRMHLPLGHSNVGSPGNNGFVHGGGGVVVVVGGGGVVILVHRDGCAVERRYSCLKIEEANYCIILILSKRLTLKISYPRDRCFPFCHNCPNPLCHRDSLHEILLSCSTSVLMIPLRGRHDSPEG